MKPRKVERELTTPESRCLLIMSENNSGTKLKNIHFGTKFVGSLFGRFLFTDWPALVEIQPGTTDITIAGCSFISKRDSEGG